MYIKHHTAWKYPYSEFFWSVISRIWTEYGEIILFPSNRQKTYGFLMISGGIEASLRIQSECWKIRTILANFINSTYLEWKLQNLVSLKFPKHSSNDSVNLWFFERKVLISSIKYYILMQGGMVDSWKREELRNWIKSEERVWMFSWPFEIRFENLYVMRSKSVSSFL